MERIKLRGIFEGRWTFNCIVCFVRGWCFCFCFCGFDIHVVLILIMYLTLSIHITRYTSLALIFVHPLFFSFALGMEIP